MSNGMSYKSVIGYQEEAPALVDTTSSPGNVYLRRNLVATTDSEGNSCWSYEEMLLTAEQYQQYVYNPMIEIIMQTLTDIQATLDEM